MRKLTKEIFIGVPLTSTLKNNDYFHTFLYKGRNGFIENSAMILQLKTFDKNRLVTRIGMINKEEFQKINEKIVRLFIPS